MTMRFLWHKRGGKGWEVKWRQWGREGDEMGSGGVHEGGAKVLEGSYYRST